MDKAKRHWIDNLASDYINRLEDNFERSKVRMLLWITLLVGGLLGLMFPFFYTSSLLIPLYCCCILLLIAVPFMVQKWKNHIWPAKILLASLLTFNTAIHLLINPANLLSTGIWFIILIMAASFMLGKNWSLGFTLITLLAITLTSIFTMQGYDLGALLGIDLAIEVNYYTPVLLIIPFFLIHFILKSFFRNKAISDNNVLNLLAEQQHLNKELQEKEIKYRKIIEGADDMIWEINDHGMITYMNPAMRRITGYDLKQGPIFYTNPLPHDFLTEYTAAFQKQILKTNPLTYTEFPIHTKSEEIIWIGQKTNMFFDGAGHMINALCLARDITAQKETEERLVEAKERAIKATLLKAQFLSSMSHEIRTPMNAVIGLIHLLLQENPRKDQVDHLKTLLFSADNLLKLINDILDFSKIEAGKIEIRNAAFSFNEIINSLRHGFGNQAKEKGIELVIKRDHRIPDRLVGDALRLSQILNNLVNNAIKFTDEGSVTLYIIPKDIRETDMEVYFAVKDTGIGIPAEKLQSVFEDFVQVNDKTLREGTGLGLSITKELLELQGSKIQLDSTFGEGSTFYFTLNLKKDLTTEIPQTSSVQKIQYSNDLNNTLQGVQVLLVEDNKINQKVAGNFLKKWGVATDIADNGAIAVQMVQEKAYDVVLMDLQMPVMDGIEATKKIRQLGGTFLELPILALTASAVLEIKDHATASGLDDFITKPFKPNTLYEKILQYAPMEVA